jgi:hypothetical protein
VIKATDEQQFAIDIRGVALSDEDLVEIEKALREAAAGFLARIDLAPSYTLAMDSPSLEAHPGGNLPRGIVIHVGSR